MRRGRKVAIDWAIDMLNSDTVILDTETTGWSGVVCQIGVIDTFGKVLLDVLVNPHCPIEVSAFDVHGISSDMVKDEKRISEVWDDLCAILKGKNLIAYNLSFDWDVLIKSYMEDRNMYAGHQDVGAMLDIKTKHCAMKMFAMFFGERDPKRRSYRWKKLDFAARHFGITRKQEHESIDDCLMTLDVIKGMANAE
jgi:DNA polymerase-3 subunit epsilon